MDRSEAFQAGARGCLMEIAVALLTASVLLTISTTYRNFDDQFACSGGLGVGFPVSFLCDYGAGGSPIDNWGRIDAADFPYFSLRGLSVDILFYLIILLIAWLIRRALRAYLSYPVENSMWVVSIAVAFLIGYVSAAVIYKADRVNFHDYIMGMPSPVPATPTPLGTPPFPESSPIPTLGP